jgi:hypothetical protein
MPSAAALVNGFEIRPWSSNVRFLGHPLSEFEGQRTQHDLRTVDNESDSEAHLLVLDEPVEVWAAVLAIALVTVAVMLSVGASLIRPPINLSPARIIDQLTVSDPMTVGAGLFAVVIALQVSTHSLRQSGLATHGDLRRLRWFTLISVVLGASTVVGTLLVVVNGAIQQNSKLGDSLIELVCGGVLVFLSVDSASVRPKGVLRERIRANTVRTTRREFRMGRVRMMEARLWVAVLVSVAVACVLFAAPFIVAAIAEGLWDQLVPLLAANALAICIVMFSSAALSMLIAWPLLTMGREDFFAGAAPIFVSLIGVAVLEYTGSVLLAQSGSGYFLPTIAALLGFPVVAFIVAADAVLSSRRGRSAYGPAALTRMIAAAVLRVDLAWTRARTANLLQQIASTHQPATTESSTRY